MVISSFISSILILALGIWAYMRLESSMSLVAEKQLLIEPSRFSYKMWKDMPVTMYQSFTFFNLTNWNQVKSIGQKPKFVEVGPYVYRTVWTKADINFQDEERQVSFAEKKQWIFQPHLSKGNLEDNQIWTINTPLMTALALIQNAPVITRNIVSVILDGLGEGAFIKRSIRSLLFEGYSDLIVSVGPLFDRRFANFNGKFAYLYNKNDSVDGVWTVSTGTDDLSTLNKITRFQSSIVNMTSFSSGQLPQGLNEVKPECAPAWSLDHATNGQLFSPFNRDAAEQIRLQQLAARAAAAGRAARGATDQTTTTTTGAPSKRFFSRSLGAAGGQQQPQMHDQQQDHHPFNMMNSGEGANQAAISNQQQDNRPAAQLRDTGKYIFYPDLCRPIHLLPGKQEVSTSNGIKASRYYIDPRVFMNSSQVPTNKCYEMNPRPALANALAATINSVTGANVAMPNLVTGASSPFAMFIPPNNHHHGDHHGGGGLFERSNHPTSFLNNALHSLGAATVGAASGGGGGAGGSGQTAGGDQSGGVASRLGRVRQLFTNIVSQRMSATGPGSLLPSLAAVPAAMLGPIGGGNNHNHHHFASSNARNAADEPMGPGTQAAARQRQSSPAMGPLPHEAMGPQGRHAGGGFGMDGLNLGGSQQVPFQSNPPPPPPTPAGGSDRWITQFRFKWPRGVFSIGQCQLGAPIYASLPHFLDADEYYLEQVDGLKPNRSLHEFYIDVESSLHSIPVGAKARLQLNVATPELRFRNIPNAMIPVLWQEVTFEIDKPVARLLYWSFTMSSTIYKTISVLLLAVGTITLVASFVGGLKQHRRQRKGGRVMDTSSIRGSVGGSSQPPTTTAAATTTTTTMASGGGQGQLLAALEGQRSSWQPHMMTRARSGGERGAPTKSRLAGSSAASIRSGGGSSNHADSLEEIRHGAALNHAFSSCTEFQEDRLSETSGGRQRRGHHNGGGGGGSGSGSGPSSAGSRASNGSPKQPSSRASSQCELVVTSGTLGGHHGLHPLALAATGGGGALNCTGCLLACLRHSPASHSATLQHHLQHQQQHQQPHPSISGDHHHNHHHHNHHHSAACGDTVNSLVRQNLVVTTSDIDKATLSSRESRSSNLTDSCNSSIYTQRSNRTFK